MTFQLPEGAFVTARQLPGLPCGEYEVYVCYRPIDHDGRHAFITDSGTVAAVWGEDVHAESRARGHAALESRLIEASNARQDARYRAYDRTLGATS